MDTPVSDLAAWLDFIKAFLWPATLLATVAMFRTELRGLLSRVSTFEFAGTKFALQSPSSEARTIESTAVPDAVVRDSTLPLSEEGVRDVIGASSLYEAGDDIRRLFRIFSTDKQTTWLAFSGKKVFCVLDDENTRGSGYLVQWGMDKGKAKPVKAKSYDAYVGTVDIGEQTDWLYSVSLFPEPSRLVERVLEALSG